VATPLNESVGRVTLATGQQMLVCRSSGGKASHTSAASSYLDAAALCLLGSLLVSGAVLGVTSASAGGSAFPGQNGRILLTQQCRGGGEANSSSCGNRFVTLKADGSFFRVLRESRGWHSPRWSPDGRRILVRTGGGGELPTTISALSPEGEKVTTIFSFQRSNRTELSVSGADWLPGGKRIVFLASKGSGSRVGIYTIGVDGTQLRKVRVFSDTPGTRGGGTFIGMRASPDGRRLAFARGRYGSVSLYVVNANGSGLRLVLTRCDLGIQDWSPDSKRLLVVSAEKLDPTKKIGECVHDYGLYTLSANGGAARLVFMEKYVPTGPGEAYGLYPPRPVFSPDGTYIAFLVQRHPSTGYTQTNTLMVIKSNGTGLREVRHGEVVLNQNRECVRCVGYGAITWQPLQR
jgi:dipeptidyl aminopeptidase/acylaminoacyl peptidase